MKKLSRFLTLPLILALLLSLLLSPALAAGETDPRETVREVYEIVSDYSLRYQGESFDELMLRAAKDYFEADPETRDLIYAALGVSDWAELYDAYYGVPETAQRLGEALMNRFEAAPKVMEAFLDTLMQQQDRYAHFMFPDDYESSYQMSDDYVGIGVTLATENPYIGQIESVFVDSPAERAGLKAGDVIIGVNGEDLEGQHYSELSARIRGEEGTSVTLRVRRGDEVLEFTMQREKITVSDISYTNNNGIAVIRVAHFNNIQTFADFFAALTAAREDGCSAVLYDLRDNSGGSVEVLLNMLQHAVFVDGAEVFSLVDRSGEPGRYTSNGLGYQPNAVAVLINGNTASASEMLAGALKYAAGATLVGSTSYGKGVGQYHITLEDESVVVVTNFEILLPGGIRYNGSGIEPDLAVEPQVIAFPADGELAALGTEALGLGSRSSHVLGLEQRLGLLGYFTGTPDDTFDDATLAALCAYQEYAGLQVCSKATPEALAALDSLFSSYAGTQAAFDRPLEAALALLRPASHMPLGVTGATAE